MHRLIRHRPSPAMVVASLALLVALGGTSVAAVSALAPNSVGTAQLKANAVTNPKIANNAVNNAKIAGNAVTSSKVANGSLKANDFAQGQIPAGPSGPAGPAGPAGPSGPSGPAGISAWQSVTATSSTAGPFTEQLSVTASCPSGKRVLGGGGEVLGDGKRYVAFNDVHTTTDGTGFYAEAAEVISTPQSWQVRAYAVCANVTT